MSSDAATRIEILNDLTGHSNIGGTELDPHPEGAN
jgi:hypothetical protein